MINQKKTNYRLLNKPAVLIISGMDPQGCAGVTADSLTASQHGCHPLPLVTALTEQSSYGMHQLSAVSATSMRRQFEQMQQDFNIRAIKVGLIPDVKIAEVIHEILLALPDVPVVLDPVMSSSRGGIEIADDVLAFMREHLFALVDVLTPNQHALSRLTGLEETVERSVKPILAMGVKNCLVRNGVAHEGYTTDYYANQDTAFYCYLPDHGLADVRGVGCVMATSIASHLAAEQDVRDAVVLAKAYLHRGLRLSEPTGPYHVIAHSPKALTLEYIPKLCYEAEYIGQQFDFPDCPNRLGIYPVVDSADWVEKLVDCGVSTIQLRVKAQPPAVLDQQIQQAVNYLRDKAVHFFVNDYWQLAITHQAYGVHLGQEDLHDAQLAEIADAGLRLGVSTHSYWELARALAVNPSYIALGPIYATTSKQMPFSPQGEERLQQWVNLLADHYPLVAIGGIDVKRAEKLKKTGVGSVAMISAITKASDYQEATAALLASWKRR